MSAVTLEDIEDALATVAAVIQANGAQGMVYMPIFERLERERERFASIDDRLAAAMARRPSQSRRGSR